MSKAKNKLELTWIGKENRAKLEPRILIEDPERSYHASHRISENDIFDNRLIYGDNLLALKALQHEFAEQVKCIYIDPPFNTGQAFDHYEDGLEHSVWLSLMRDRITILRDLLSPDGSIWVQLDDNEIHYLKVVMDEIFGRACFVTSVAVRISDNSNNNALSFSDDKNHILVYGKTRDWRPKFLQDMKRRSHFKNPDGDPMGPWFDGNPVNNPGLRPNLQFDLTAPNGNVIKHPPNGWRWSKETIESKLRTGELRFSEDGTRLIRRTYLNDLEGLPPSNLWIDLWETGHSRQAKYELKSLFPDRAATDLFSTPKPERLLKRIIELATNPGDLVLDSFAGSGTTGAVAHKMRRRWIMVELGEHCHRDIIPRLKKVIDGEDSGGASSDRELIWETKLSLAKLRNAESTLSEMKEAETNASADTNTAFVQYEAKMEGGNLRLYGVRTTRNQPGGGFRYFKLGPTLIVNDEWGNPVINPDFNAAMLAEAMCKLEGFTFDPDPDTYWQQGYSSETDFIYVTTQFMSNEMLAKMSEDVGPNRSLLICCSAFRADVNRYDNLNVKKIPKAVLRKCEWGHDDYSLEVANLPDAPADADDEQLDQPLFDFSDETGGM